MISDDPLQDDELDDVPAPAAPLAEGGVISHVTGADAKGQRLDRILAAALPTISNEVRSGRLAASVAARRLLDLLN